MGKGGGKPPPDSQDSVALAQIAAEKYNLYQQFFVPLESQFIKNAVSQNAPEVYEATAGLSSAQFAAPQAAALEESSRLNIEKRGLDPSSAAFRSPALRKAAALSKGMGLAQTGIDTTNRYFSGLESVVAMGQGQSGQAMKGLAEMSGLSADRAEADAERAFNAASSRMDLAGNALGFSERVRQEKSGGPSGYGMGG